MLTSRRPSVSLRSLSDVTQSSETVKRYVTSATLSLGNDGIIIFDLHMFSYRRYNWICCHLSSLQHHVGLVHIVRSMLDRKVTGWLACRRLQPSHWVVNVEPLSQVQTCQQHASGTENDLTSDCGTPGEVARHSATDPMDLYSPVQPFELMIQQLINNNQQSCGSISMIQMADQPVAASSSGP